MKSKKILACLLGTLFVTSTVLTACSSTPTSSNNNDIVTLKWYSIGQEPQDLDTVLQKVNEYLGEKIGVNINMSFIDYGDYDQKMNVIMNTGSDYDLAFTCSWAGDYLGNSRKGAFLELDSYLDNQGKDMKTEIDSRFWAGAKIDGKTYAVPNQKELGISPMWMFDQELVEKYNIPYKNLKTLEDLEPWLKLIKEKEPDFVPLYINKTISFDQGFDQIIEPLGFDLSDSSLKVINIFESDAIKEKLKTLERFYKAGYINSDSNAQQNDDRSIKRFAYKADGQPYAEKIWSRDYKRNMVATPMTDTWVTNASTTGSMIAVAKNTKYPEKAVEFLNLLNTDEYLRNLINFGVEGIHYDLTDKGQVKIKEPVTYNVSYMSVGNLFKTKTLDGDPITKWDDFKKFNNEAKIAPSLGFKFNSTGLENEIAAINNVLDEFKSSLYSGAVDVDSTLKAFNEKLYAQGLQKIMDEMQKQVNTWKNSK